MTWMLIDWFVQGKPKLMGACGGAICGMVVITPGAGYMQTSMGVLTGIIGAILCYNAVPFVEWLGIDDAVDSTPVHGMGGFLGALLIGVLSDPSECGVVATAPDWCVNPGTATRSLHMLGIQLFCATVSATWSMSATYLILKTLNCINMAPILATFEEQNMARDNEQHGEEAYSPFPFRGDVAQFPKELRVSDKGENSSSEDDETTEIDKEMSVPLMSPRHER